MRSDACAHPMRTNLKRAYENESGMTDFQLGLRNAQTGNDKQEAPQNFPYSRKNAIFLVFR